jgi:hypothetical protein
LWPEMILQPKLAKRLIGDFAAEPLLAREPDIP